MSRITNTEMLKLKHLRLRGSLAAVPDSYYLSEDVWPAFEEREAEAPGQFEVVTSKENGVYVHLIRKRKSC